MRIMALDMGTKRVGVAVSDELLLAANGLTVIERKSLKLFVDQIVALTLEHQVHLVVLGLPRRMDGRLGPEAEKILEMAEELKKRGLTVDTWDERLSTAAVERVLIDADMTRKKRKKVMDKVAATYILQGYLDYLRTRQGADRPQPISDR
ncbi:MAG: Holliday junction resolvase RuvX [Deltaproteobacteria bacterium]|nr:Holliday junction resolvase RuvX [Deltaproteobacteria bacterium]